MRDGITASVVFRGIIAVFSGAVLSLGGVGVVIALSNGRPGLSVALVLLTIAVVTGAVLGGVSVLRKYDTEAYEFRRHD